MGTRNLVGVIQGAAWKIAQYSQWDGYPSGQGLTVLEFLRTADLTEFAERVAKCRFGTGQEIDAAYEKFSTNGMMTLDQSAAFKKSEYGYLSRDTGADILQLVANAPNGLLLKDSHEFAVDGLFCEWAYVIDLDKMVLEVYSGFHKTPVPEGERFANMTPADQCPPEYSPVHLAKSYPIRLNAEGIWDLPTDEQFVADLEPDDNEDED